ncbi:MAG: uridine kinase [Thermoanaerobaculia bacterium]|nr:MAG: uridine kinase [Thermoanaerobaculia bacterium]
MTPVTLAVAGGTGSGKTTVAMSILEAAGPGRIAFLAQDNYYRDIVWSGPEEIAAHNFDHPDALDTPLLVRHLTELKAGRAIDLPVYDFVRHRRTGETVRIEARPVILVEGILLFAEPAVRALLDFKVFVDTDPDVRLVRRIRRDLAERGRSIADVLRQYMETVRPMHLEFVEPSKRWADLIVPEGGENKVALEMVIARVEQLLARAEAPASR